MSSTNKTTNYNLSQFVGTDVPSWLGDYNGDMSKIDKAIGDVANSQGSVEQTVVGLTAEVQGLSTQVSGVATSVQQVQTSVAQIDTAYKQADTALSQRITTNANNIQTNTTAIENINTAIGTTDISGIGDGTIKGAISSINSSLTNSGTIRYNEETHYIQVMINGEWVDYKYFNPNETVALIPLMTSNTMPSGIASASSADSGYEAYKAFDQNASTNWFGVGTNKTQDGYLQYEFAKEVTITKFETTDAGISVGDSSSIYGTLKLLTSLDGNTWNEAYVLTRESGNTPLYLPNTIELEKPKTCKYIKLKIDGFGWACMCKKLQAYGYK